MRVKRKKADSKVVLIAEVDLTDVALTEEEENRHIKA